MQAGQVPAFTAGRKLGAARARTRADAAAPTITFIRPTAENLDTHLALPYH